jgi:hypothetical protein
LPFYKSRSPFKYNELRSLYYYPTDANIAKEAGDQEGFKLYYKLLNTINLLYPTGSIPLSRVVENGCEVMVNLLLEKVVSADPAWQSWARENMYEVVTMDTQKSYLLPVAIRGVEGVVVWEELVGYIDFI